MAQRKQGRPAKPKSQQRLRQFNFRLTEAEYRLVEDAANGYPPSTWARVELLRLARKEVQKMRRGGMR